MTSLRILIEKDMIGEHVVLENKEDGSSDWKGILLKLVPGSHVILLENGKRKIIPFTSFVDMVFAEDEYYEKNSK